MSTNSAVGAVRAPDGRKVTEVAVGVMVQPGSPLGGCRYLLAQRLQGIFAFAIYDVRQRTVSLVRDHMGVKPLYWRWDGEVLAFLTWTPLYRGNGWTLDNMRRAQQTPPGTMEYLIAESMEWARVRGYSAMSLSLAPLAGLREEVRGINDLDAPPRWRITPSARLLQRSAAYLHRRGMLLGNYRSLYFFKSKFQPIWEPRYLVLTDASALPRVLIALAVVHGMEWRTAVRDIWASAPFPRARAFPFVR